MRRRRTRTLRTSLAAVAAASALSAVPSCARERLPTVRVFAAASLTAPFERLARDFERTHPNTSVALHFAGTPRLTLQLRQGAPADVFASADQVQMQAAIELGVVRDQPVVFAANHMVIVTAPDNPKRIQGLSDLARAGVTVLLCAANVPAGRYARQCLAKADVRVTSLSDEPNVRAVVSKIQLGLADAGIVYASDAHSARGHLHSVTIPERHNTTAAYPIAVLALGERPELARAFVSFATGPQGQAVLREHGFSRP